MYTYTHCIWGWGGSGNFWSCCQAAATSGRSLGAVGGSRKQGKVWGIRLVAPLGSARAPLPQASVGAEPGSCCWRPPEGDAAPRNPPNFSSFSSLIPPHSLESFLRQEERPRQDHLQHGSSCVCDRNGESCGRCDKALAEQNKTSDPVESRKQQRWSCQAPSRASINVTHTCFLSEQCQKWRANTKSQAPFETCKSWSNITEEQLWVLGICLFVFVVVGVNVWWLLTAVTRKACVSLCPLELVSCSSYWSQLGRFPFPPLPPGSAGEGTEK